MDEQNQCKDCEYYNQNDDRCGAFECYGIDCPILPCERNDASEK